MSLTLDTITHDYGAGPVVEQVTFEVRPGEVHALLGMNGAGKSTLLHIASGALAPSNGRILIDGLPVDLARPGEAARHGIVLLAQEVDRALVPQQSVHENLTVMLRRRRGGALFSARRNRAEARDLLLQYGVDIDVDRAVGGLSIYEKQLISLVRAVSDEARYILLDEPTATFDQRESERFYAIVDRLRLQGIGIVFISHKLHEVFRIADRVTVLRGGAIVLADAAGTTPVANVVEAMTGSTGHTSRREPRSTDAVTRFAAAAVELGPDRAPIDLTVGRGEIVVVFGLLGAGKTRLARRLFGLDGPYRAEIDGTPVRIASSRQAVRHGMSYVPEERRRHGIWTGSDIRTHFALGFGGLIRAPRERAHADRLIADFGVHPANSAQLAGRLSGGNQQKVAIAKWFGAPRALALFDEPMKGIDVSAKEAIFQMIEQSRTAGTSILYFTAEPDDAVRIADRIIVLARTGIVAEFDAQQVTPTQLMLAADPEANAPTPSRTPRRENA